MSSTLAMTALGAATLGAGVADSPAQASIASTERSGWVQTYEIPSGAMAKALNLFADVNGLHIAYDPRVTQRLTTPGLKGSYALSEGLSRLLQGSGLSYRFSDNGRSVSIVLARNDTGARSDAGAEELPAIDVGAERPRAEGPSDGKGLTSQNSYVVPNASTVAKREPRSRRRNFQKPRGRRICASRELRGPLRNPARRAGAGRLRPLRPRVPRRARHRARRLALFHNPRPFPPHLNALHPASGHAERLAPPHVAFEARGGVPREIVCG